MFWEFEKSVRFLVQDVNIPKFPFSNVFREIKGSHVVSPRDEKHDILRSIGGGPFLTIPFLETTMRCLVAS